MFHELYLWLTSPCPPYVRRMRYLYQIIAMRGRYLRHRESWHPHLEKTKQFILASAARCADHSSIVVLGSGLLLDFPLAELAERFDEVILADIVHLPEVQKTIRPYPNVRLAQCDVTGVAERIYQNVRQGRRELPQGSPFFPEADGAGLLISLNLVSQLAAVPSDYILREMPELQGEGLNAWCDNVREDHVEALRSLSCDVCLVADYAYTWRDRDGEVAEEGSTIGNLVIPNPEQVWKWHIAPLGEVSKKWSKELTVGAWYLRKSTRPGTRL
ncbi:MAG: hypothetical protein FD164_2186 [Nitrospirae bacterium]|nr:MAG: hypothetical protein FD164_2186 [Nitrospirota bacterium]